jgi:LysR family hca operon transcriptional activator
MTDDLPVELRHLRYFIAVAKHGSFNRAAQTLHLTQPALSRQVKDLEEELAAPLLVRGTNAVALTEAGKLFYEEALEVIARAELAVQRVRDERRVEVLRIGYAPSVTSSILPRALQRFHAEQSRVRVELADLFPHEMTRMAANGELDIVITLEGPGPSAPDFRWEELCRLRLVLVMPAKHDLAKLKQIPPRRLRGLALVGLDQESFPEYVPHIRKILKPFGIRPRFVAFERDGVSTVFTTLEAYHAAAIVADSAVNFMPRSLVCRPIVPGFDPVIAKIGWSSTRSPHAMLFVNLLRQEAQRLSRGTKIRRGKADARMRSSNGSERRVKQVR